jgi:dTMP kinase
MSVRRPGVRAKMAEEIKVSGYFISFEGCDGSGKSTQAKMLGAYLREQGHEVVMTREPGGSEGAEEIRALILNGDADRWSAETELLLFNAARRDHVERVIQPAVARGAIVICDRFADSTRVYQGVARADLRPMVDQLHAMMIGVEPDLTILMDIDPDESLRRGLARVGAEERFESMGNDFQRAIHAGFASLALEFPDRVIRVDGAGTPEDVLPRVIAAAQTRLNPEPQVFSGM